MAALDSLREARGGGARLPPVCVPQARLMRIVDHRAARPGEGLLLVDAE